MIILFVLFLVSKEVLISLVGRRSFWYRLSLFLVARLQFSLFATWKFAQFENLVRRGRGSSSTWVTDWSRFQWYFSLRLLWSLLEYYCFSGYTRSITLMIELWLRYQCWRHHLRPSTSHRPRTRTRTQNNQWAVCKLSEVGSRHRAQSSNFMSNERKIIHGAFSDAKIA